MRRAALVALTLLAAPASAEEAWRAGAFDGQVTAHIAFPADEGRFAAAVYLGFSCGAKPALRLRAPVPLQPVSSTARPLSIAFEAAGEAQVLTMLATFGPIQAARAPDNWSGVADPDRVEMIAEFAVEDPGEIVALRDLARFVMAAAGETLSVQGATPAFRLAIPLSGARRAVGRYLSACAGLS